MGKYLTQDIVLALAREHMKYHRMTDKSSYQPTGKMHMGYYMRDLAQVRSVFTLWHTLVDHLHKFYTRRKVFLNSIDMPQLGLQGS